MRALEDVVTAHPGVSRRLLTLTREAMPAEVPKNVLVQPAYAWLLEDKDQV